MNGPFIWHELSSPNVESSTKFYNAVFGWTTEGMNMGDFTYHIFKDGKNPMGIGGMMQTDGPGMENVPPVWAMYLHVEDVDAAVARVTENGGSVCVPAMDVPDVGRMAMVTDPHGAAFWVMTPKMPAA